MANKRRKSKRPETPSCSVLISSIRWRVSLSMRDANKPDPELDFPQSLRVARNDRSRPMASELWRDGACVLVPAEARRAKVGRARLVHTERLRRSDSPTRSLAAARSLLLIGRVQIRLIG